MSEPKIYSQSQMDAALYPLVEWIKQDALCPCCQQHAICDPECTFAEDSPDEWERMDAARSVLYGGAQ